MANSGGWIRKGEGRGGEAGEANTGTENLWRCARAHMSICEPAACVRVFAEHRIKEGRVSRARFARLHKHMFPVRLLLRPDTKSGQTNWMPGFLGGGKLHIPTAPPHLAHIIVICAAPKPKFVRAPKTKSNRTVSGTQS